MRLFQAAFTCDLFKFPVQPSGSLLGGENYNFSNLMHHDIPLHSLLPVDTCQATLIGRVSNPGKHERAWGDVSLTDTVRREVHHDPFGGS